jgi:hypothetical protein
VQANSRPLLCDGTSRGCRSLNSHPGAGRSHPHRAVLYACEWPSCGLHCGPVGSLPCRSMGSRVSPGMGRSGDPEIRKSRDPDRRASRDLAIRGSAGSRPWVTATPGHPPPAWACAGSALHALRAPQRERGSFAGLQAPRECIGSAPDAPNVPDTPDTPRTERRSASAPLHTACRKMQQNAENSKRAPVERSRGGARFVAAHS